MVFYLGILLIPLIVILAVVWIFFSGRRTKADETGRAEVRAAQQPRTETRAHGREA